MTIDASEHGFERLICKAKADHSCALPNRHLTRIPHPSISVAITGKCDVPEENAYRAS